MKKLVLIDGTNFYFRGSFVGELNVNGRSIKYIYAFLRNMISLIKTMQKDNSEVDYVCCWDGGYSQRLRISQEAVERGVVPKSYKQQRRQSKQFLTQEQKKQKQQFKKQMIQVRELFSKTKIQQCFVLGEQADDLISSFVVKYKQKYDQIILVTTDRDYYQLLYQNVKIFNPQKKIYLDRNFLYQNFGFYENQKMIQVGALSGQSGSGGDTIYGVQGIGYKIGAKLICQYGSIQNILNSVKDFYKSQIQKQGGIDLFLKVIQSGQFIPKKFKNQLKVLKYEYRLKLAYELKKMRDFLQVQIIKNKSEWQFLNDYFLNNHINISHEDFCMLL